VNLSDMIGRHSPAQGPIGRLSRTPCSIDFKSLKVKSYASVHVADVKEERAAHALDDRIGVSAVAFTKVFPPIGSLFRPSADLAKGEAAQRICAAEKEAVENRHGSIERLTELVTHR